jgi:UDPglucose 6-dehydrogenase
VAGPVVDEVNRLQESIMDIGIVGFGFVGESLVELFGDDNCHIYDAYREGYDTPECKAAVNAAKFAFVSVPTPVGHNGECDTSIVEEVVGWLKSEYIVIRSTVAPGTTDRLREKTGKKIVFQPEYVGETVAHPLLDHKMQEFVILGGNQSDTSPIADLYQRFYHSNVQFFQTDSVTAEVTKYMENSFYAMKVMFCNEFFGIAEAHGVDYNELRELWLADPRISRDHTFVYPDNRGFSGKCLPKDVSGIIASSKEHGFDAQLLRNIMSANKDYRVDDETYGPYRNLSL